MISSYGVSNIIAFSDTIPGLFVTFDGCFYRATHHRW